MRVISHAMKHWSQDFSWMMPEFVLGMKNAQMQMTSDHVEEKFILMSSCKPRRLERKKERQTGTIDKQKRLYLITNSPSDLGVKSYIFYSKSQNRDLRLETKPTNCI